MKIIRALSLLVLVLTISSFTKIFTNLIIPARSVAVEREFYQLKTYILKTDQQVEKMDKYLKEAYIPGLKNLGIKSIGVFKPIKNENDSIKKIIVLIPFSSMSQFLSLDEKLAKDKTYLAKGADYLNTLYSQPTYKRIESILLRAFPDHPILIPSKLDSPRANRVYELRNYESATEAYHKNKVEMFNAGGEIKLFNRLECNAVFYAQVISGPKMPNLMYMTTYANQESRDAHWKAFSDSPEWKSLIAIEKYKNNISHIDKIFLYPTEYSDY
ncbi:NIPSNAP family protein [Flavobacterium franklandianum]|uniref:NIPSNAP family containing protein n=1 Tax=Flavobacterium franklandianum TaxID=2594430 RepID=A0A553C6M8_9FLAO|nr:NIPSNAP family protein [Flavobacterium franklandianum]TRX16062.1 NIPSNAP family containing protein [Flavobacterium franklandianum]